VIMAAEFDKTGRCEISSFQALVNGKICIAETTASACGVLNKIGALTTGSGPRMRPSWLIRSARAANAMIDVTSKAAPCFHSLPTPIFFIFNSFHVARDSASKCSSIYALRVSKSTTPMTANV
jgi:hypothetical protein